MPSETIGQDRAQALSEIAGVPVKVRVERNVYVFTFGYPTTIAEVWTYRKAKAYADGMQAGREALKRLAETLLVLRIEAGADSCNSHHINHVEGQIRGLAAILRNGETPPAHFHYDLTVILDWAGVPHTKDKDGIHWHEDWLTQHGFKVIPHHTGDPNLARIEHPTLGKGW
jgi:hypothetical protein